MARAAAAMPVVASSCSLARLWPEAWRLQRVWRAVCRACAVPCVDFFGEALPAERLGTTGVAAEGVRAGNKVEVATAACLGGGPCVLIDSSRSGCELAPDAPPLQGAPHAFVHFSWDRAPPYRFERGIGDVGGLSPAARRRIPHVAPYF